jgi:butyrate kinase
MEVKIMSERTEKKLEALENDLKAIEEKQKQIAERLRAKKTKAEETRNLVIVEIVHENNVSISDLKAILKNGGKPPEPTKTTIIRKENEHEESF